MYYYGNKQAFVVKTMEKNGEELCLIQRVCWNGSVIFQWVSKNELTEKK